ncbi:hypothetical protein QFZ27_001704 [Inquilinus ginsengisoli]
MIEAITMIGSWTSSTRSNPKASPSPTKTMAMPALVAWTDSRSRRQSFDVSKGIRYSSRKTSGGSSRPVIAGWRLSRYRKRRRREGLVLRDGQAGRVDVGPAVAPVEIVPDSVVPGMLAAPVREGREGDQAAQAAEHQVGAARGEERRVPAIMLDEEEAHGEAGRDHRQPEGQPVRHPQAGIHRGADRDEAGQCRGQLPDRPRQARRPETGHLGSQRRIGVDQVSIRFTLSSQWRPSWKPDPAGAI